MAIKNCSECGNPVSTKAQSCPNCGAVVKQRTSRLAGCIAVGVIAVMVIAVLYIVMGPDFRFSMPTGPIEAFKAQEALRRGDSSSEKGDFESAIAAYSEAIRLKPDRADAYFGRGVAHAEKNKYDLAIADYTDAIRLSPNHATYFNRAIAYTVEKKYDLAVADWSKAIELSPDAEAYFNRALIRGERAEYDLAIADYTEAIRLKPDYALAYVCRGNVFEGKGDHDRAIADYTEAIRAKPDLAEAYLSRGNEYIEKAEFDRAIADYTDAIRLKPDYANAYHNRGVAYERKGEKTKAEADFAEAKKRKAEEIQAEGDSVRVTISPEFRQLPVEEDLTNRKQLSERMFCIAVAVTNKSQEKKIDFEGWANSIGFAILRDNLGNKYKMVDFGLGVSYPGKIESASIYPGKSVEEVLLFEMPIDKATSFELTLSGERVGESRDLVIEFPRTAIIDKEEEERRRQEAAEKEYRKRAAEAEKEEAEKRRRRAEEVARRIEVEKAREAAANEFREWTDHTGKHRTRAKLTAVLGGTAVLNPDFDATPIQVSLESLSREDLAYIMRGLNESSSEYRTWTDNKQRAVTKAQFVGVVWEKVVLELETDKKEVEVLFARLSKADQEYVKQHPICREALRSLEYESWEEYLRQRRESRAR